MSNFAQFSIFNSSIPLHLVPTTKKIEYVFDNIIDYDMRNEDSEVHTRADVG